MSIPPQEKSPSRFHSRLEKLAGKPWFWAAFVFLAFSWPLARAFFFVEPLPDIPIEENVPDFKLLDHRGLDFGPKKLQGQVWIVHAMCTECPSENAKVQEYMQDIQHRARNLGGAFRIVSITVDPKNDTPDVLKNFIENNPISRNRWRFLTGSEEQVRPLMLALFNSQDLADIPSDIQGPILPPERMWNIVLIDQKMRIRGLHDMRDEQAVDRLLFHAGLVVNRHR
jgi:cytochrome oxidase Cu insertion factor (SCO1/SenC/PrrC family)